MTFSWWKKQQYVLSFVDNTNVLWWFVSLRMRNEKRKMLYQYIVVVHSHFATTLCTTEKIIKTLRHWQVAVLCSCHVLVPDAPLFLYDRNYVLPSIILSVEVRLWNRWRSILWKDRQNKAEHGLLGNLQKMRWSRISRSRSSLQLADFFCHFVGSCTANAYIFPRFFKQFVPT